jgi:hypothetical protein
MITQRQRPIFVALGALLVIWVLAIGGYKIAQNAKITPEKIRAYTASLDFSRLSAAERAAALQKLAAQLNALSLEERQRLRLDRLTWFEAMNEAEKGAFLEATLPTGFKQMLNSFEEMPPDKRQRVVEQASRQMKEAREKLAAGGSLPGGPNNGMLSAELQEQVTKIGLKSYYSQSSAQTKAELAPLLEEMQRMMENGRMTMHVGGPRQ